MAEDLLINEEALELHLSNLHTRVYKICDVAELYEENLLSCGDSGNLEGEFPTNVSEIEKCTEVKF